MSGTKIVIDTDILSMFAKVGAMHILCALLGQGRIVPSGVLWGNDLGKGG